MLALFGCFTRKKSGWTRLHTQEGIKLLMPRSLVRKVSSAESLLGHLTVTMYSARQADSNFSMILSIRDYEPTWLATSDEFFADWKAEFLGNMDRCGVDIKMIKEEAGEGPLPRCDMLLVNSAETAYTRVSLISQGNRLVILFAVGKPEEIAGTECSESFKTIKV